jgi:D-methionine transport system substrate-binding protein
LADIFDIGVNMLSKIKSLLTVTGLTLTVLLAGCNDKDTEVDMSKVKVGVIAGSEAQVAEAAAKVAKEKYNLDVELIIFSDYVTPNAALEEGSIDANAFQHKPYLDQQIKDRGYQFAIAGNSFVYPIAGYSNKVTSIDELSEGDQIAVPNDPTNLARSLLLLEQQGLIQLKEGAGLTATVLDIVSSPKNLEIVELEAPQLVRSLDDVTLAVINTTYASNINLSPEKDGVFVEDKNSPYVNLIVARKDNVNAENVQKFVQAYQSEEVYQVAMDEFKDGVVKGW